MSSELQVPRFVARPWTDRESRPTLVVMADQHHADFRSRWREWCRSPAGAAEIERSLVEAIARLARDLTSEAPPTFAAMMGEHATGMEPRR